MRLKTILLSTLILFLFSNMLNGQSLMSNSIHYIDSDNNYFHKNTAGFEYDRSKLKLSLWYGEFTLSDTDKLKFDVYGLGLSYPLLGGKNQFSVEVEYLVNDIVSNQTNYNMRYSMLSTRLINFELNSDYGLLGTTSTAINDVDVLSNSISLDLHVIPNALTVTSGYTLQNIFDISGDTNRDIYNLNLILYPSTNSGIMFRNRFLRSNTISPLYFSPEEFDTHMLSTFYSFVVFNNNMVIRPLVGYGFRNINGEYDTTYEFGLRSRGWVKDRLGFQLETTYGNTSSTFGNYRFLMTTLGLKWKLN